MRTWVYRGAHNTATSHITRAVHIGRQRFVTLDELEAEPASQERAADEMANRQRALERLYALVQRLDPFDRQIIVSYLDGIEAAEIAEIVGASPGAVVMKIHRLKRVLARQFQEGLVALVLEDGRQLIDDFALLDRHTGKRGSPLSKAFLDCKGGHWIAALGEPDPYGAALQSSCSP